MDSCSLQHTSDSKVHDSAGFHAACVPPSGFGYPLDGLLPSKSQRSSSDARSAPGIRPFEASAALQDIATSPPRWTHVLFLPRLMQERELSARRHGPQLLGLDPARQPRLWNNSSASPITRQLPWGSPFQGSPARALIPSGITSHVLSRARRGDPPTCTSESRSARTW